MGVCVWRRVAVMSAVCVSMCTASLNLSVSPPRDPFLPLLLYHSLILLLLHTLHTLVASTAPSTS